MVWYGFPRCSRSRFLYLLRHIFDGWICIIYIFINSQSATRICVCLLKRGEEGGDGGSGAIRDVPQIVPQLAVG